MTQHYPSDPHLSARTESWRSTLPRRSRNHLLVGVCGGLAGDPLGAAILTGLGVRELSMSQRDIAPVKAALRACDSALLAELAQLALDSADADSVRALAARLQAPRQVKR
mgnify:CR=1 FL=1